MVDSPFLIEIEPEPPTRLERLLSRYKESRARTIVSEREDRWPREAYEELTKQHPWVARLKVRPVISTSSEEGYALGYFQVTSRELPAAVTGPETASVVSIPILIESNKLYPFDVFGFKGRFYPLTEDALTKILRVRDIFRETDRRDFRSRLSLTGRGDALSVRDLGSGGISYKLSAAPVDHLLQTVEASLQAVPRIDRSRTAIDLRKQFMAKFSHASGVEFRRTDAALEARPIWRHRPENGRPGFGAWQELPYEQVEELLGEKTSSLLTGRSWVSNFNPITDEEVISFQQEAARLAPREKRSTSEIVYKAPLPATPVKVKYRCSSPGIETKFFTGIPMTRFYLGGRDSCYPYNFLSFLVPSASGGIYPYQPSQSNTISVLPTTSVQAPAGGEDLRSSDPFIVWLQDGVLKFLPIAGHTLTRDGGGEYVAAQDGDVDAKISIVPGLKALATLVDSAGTVEYLVPKETSAIYDSSRFVAGEEMIKGLVAVSEETEAPVEDAEPVEETEELPEGAIPVAVSKTSGGRFNLRTDHLDSLPFPPHSLTQPELRSALCMLGASPEAVDEAIKVSEDAGYCVFHVRDYGLRAVPLSVEETLSKISANAKRSYPALSGYAARAVRAAKGLEKVASTSAYRRAIDNVLELGFLSEENLLQFVDLLPTFEETQSALCALLIASRLGLEEIPEQQCEAAIRSLAPILKGLRTIEFSLLR